MSASDRHDSRGKAQRGRRLQKQESQITIELCPQAKGPQGAVKEPHLGILTEDTSRESGMSSMMVTFPLGRAGYSADKVLRSPRKPYLL